jgi:hypothetical protein
MHNPLNQTHLSEMTSNESFFQQPVSVSVAIITEKLGEKYITCPLDFIWFQIGQEAELSHAMTSLVTAAIERGVVGIIEFARRLPGFRSLPIDDQISLIKSWY